MASNINNDYLVCDLCKKEIEYDEEMGQSNGQCVVCWECLSRNIQDHYDSRYEEIYGFDDFGEDTYGQENGKDLH
jgi:uncharacterized CHY-type Zn-finger protein